METGSARVKISFTLVAVVPVVLKTWYQGLKRAK